MISVEDVPIKDLNLPCDGSLDTKEYREAYRDLMKTSKTTRESGLTYYSFLTRMKERNIASRKAEFERRSITLDPIRDKIIIDAMRQTKEMANA